MSQEENTIAYGLADIESIVGAVRTAVAKVVQVSAVTKSKAAETDRLTDENRVLRRHIEDLEAKLAEHKRLAQEKVDALEELLSKATLPDEEPEAPKAPAVEVMPGPDYVTRAELRTALAHVAVQFGGPVHEALRHVAHELVKP